MSPIDPRDADRLRRQAGQHQVRENHGASERPVHGTVVVPSSLLPPHCSGCGAPQPDATGDAFDLTHDDGCLLGAELTTERAADDRHLAAMAASGLAQRFERAATEAEADQRPAAAGATVVVSLGENGSRSRWWPTLDPDDLT